MKFHVLAFYFFCWIAIRIHVSLAAQRGEPLEEDGPATRFLDTEVETAATSTAQCDDLTAERNKFLNYLDGLMLHSGDKTYEALESHKYIPMIMGELLFYCPLYNSIRHGITSLNMEHLVKPIDSHATTLFASFLKKAEKNKSKLLKMLPQLNESEHAVLEEQFKRYEKLNWSYKNKKIVKEADKITADLIWAGEETPDDRVLYVTMYHVLNDELQNMKKQLLESNRVISLTKELQNIIGGSHFFLTEKEPCDTQKLDNSTFVGAHNAILLCQRQLENASSIEELSENVSIIDTAIEKLTQWLLNLKQEISEEVEHLKSILESVSDESGKELLNNMVTQYYTSVDRRYKRLTRKIPRKDTEKIFTNVITQLKSVYHMGAYCGIFFGGMKKRLLLFFNEELQSSNKLLRADEVEQMKKRNPHYNAIVTSIQKLKYLKTYKLCAKVMKKIFKSLKGAVASGALESSDKTAKHHTPDDKTLTLQHFQNELRDPIRHITWLRNTIYLNIKLNAILKQHERYNSTIRMLQYFWSTANKLSEMVETHTKYKKDTRKRERALKHIALALYNSVLAIKKFSEYGSGM